MRTQPGVTALLQGKIHIVVGHAATITLSGFSGVNLGDFTLSSSLGIKRLLSSQW